MKLSPNITLTPFLHGKAECARQVRRLFSDGRFDCVAIDLPPAFEDALPQAVEHLPHIAAVMARGVDDPVYYYIPTDPCDAAIEALRQAAQNRIPCFFAGYPALYAPAPLAPLPDAYALRHLGPDAFYALCVHAIGNPAPDSPEDRDSRHIACFLRSLEQRYSRILALVHLRHATRSVWHYHHPMQGHAAQTETPAYRIETALINPDHLYFALGELPFIAGKWEQERCDPFAPPLDIAETVKELFRETRDEYYDQKNPAVDLSPARLQAGLTFARNLALMSGVLTPSLFDIVQAAKGVGGNAFALRILASAKYYPFLPIERHGPMIGVGIDRISLPFDNEPHEAVNLLRDTALVWKALPIKAELPPQRLRSYRYRWNPAGMCSHVPEDRFIENFNAHVRAKALRIISEDLVKTEKFTVSAKDGVDIRETLRNWHTGQIYVREIPPSRGSVDTVVIIFDDAHDERYPHQAVWYAEHDEESTLTFYATDPFADLIGPGIARSIYGGLSLLFPPRLIPNAFEITRDLTLDSLAERLIYGAMLHSQQPAIACIAPQRPSLRLTTLARARDKRLLWIPMASFSSETLRKLRRFHVLNGKIVRSWASHFIGD